MARKRTGAAEGFLMYFSSIVAIFLIISLSFGSSPLPMPAQQDSSVALSSGLFVVLAMSMFLYLTLRIGSARRGV